MKGLYIHIPFCKSKCGYCDFYSFCPSQEQADEYLTAVCTCMESWSKKISGGFDTVYFGGGTPSFFGGKRIAKILESAKNCFEISPSSEITVECNPSSCDEALFDALSQCGVNRISLGVQSAKTEERKLLGRNSDCAQVRNAI
ncbi:MAG: radical SAM protein, partial [Acutalibacteraceae bacterium]